MARRLLLAVVLSLVVHAALIGGAVGVSLVRSFPSLGPVDVEIAGLRLDEVKDLPLGAPRSSAAGPVIGEAAVAIPEHPRRAHAKAAASADHARKRGADEQIAKAGDRPAPERPDRPDGGPDGGAVPRPADLKGYGPEGSRLTVLLRIDRLRATPYAGMVDELLSELPDRNGLLEGTGLDLYRDFDALLIATPNPLDYTATFLALRHHLTDRALRDAIDKGAAATGRMVRWSTIAERPVGERRARDPARADRDDRLMVLPAPGLAVVTPPVYAKLILRPPAPAGSAADAGEGDAGGPDAGAHEARRSWTDLLDRIDAEDGALPDEAVAMLTAADIFRARPGPGAPDSGADAAGRVPLAFDLPLPTVLTLIAGAKPATFLDLRAELATEADARLWESRWPDLHQQARVNPWLVLAGFGPLVDRIEVSREGAVLRAHLAASEVETRLIFQMLTRVVDARLHGRP